MASTGVTAWNKHFKGKGDIETVVKTETTLYDVNMTSVGKIPAGEKILFLETKSFEQKTPIKYKNNLYFINFNAVQKPLGKGVSGVKLKPQDFTFFTKETWKAEELAKQLVDEIEERSDLAPDLKTYLVALTKYWGKLGKVTAKEFNGIKKPTTGINEINKDYGEILGAIACIKHNILFPHIKVSANAKISFPLRGNEPLVDYYIIDGKKKHSISAKSGSTTNTLKPGDVMKLLESMGEWDKWKTKGIGKLIDSVVNNTAISFPFNFINEIQPNTLSKSALEEAKTFKTNILSKKEYDVTLFKNLLKTISIPGKPKTYIPTVGEMFYYTEKYIIDTANNNAKYDPTNIFVHATTGNVVYVKYAIGTQAEGQFEILIPDTNKIATQKKIKWRSKNASNRASDKIGMQP